MSSPRLTGTSFIVIGLLERIEPATPYDLKQLAELSTINFWNVPHTQLYTECSRLAEAGLLEEEREQTGRRRRIYRVTEKGREALRIWLSESTEQIYELRDTASLKLFLGADPSTMAVEQLEVHKRQLESYEALYTGVAADAPRGWRLALEGGIGHQHEFIRFWSKLLESKD